MFRLFRFYSETASFGVSVKPKLTETNRNQPKQAENSAFCFSILSLKLSVLHHLVLSLDVSFLLPLNLLVCALAAFAAFLCLYSSLCCLGTRLFYNSMCCLWTCVSSMAACAALELVSSTAVCAFPGRVCVSALQCSSLYCPRRCVACSCMLVLQMHVFVQQQPMLCQEVYGLQQHVLHLYCLSARACAAPGRVFLVFSRTFVLHLACLSTRALCST